ncbi:MAG: ABC transporter permease [Actinobacteria bacterium]|nr:ABC transporter permease [Actinomycetota bacterium]
MTGASAQVSSPVSKQGHRTGFGHVLLAEWTKIRSVRSTVWSLILYVILTLGVSALFTWLAVHAVQTRQASGAELRGDPAGVILRTGLLFGQLAIAVLGVLVMTTEYSTGVIRASLLAVPRRLSVLIAKCAVFAVLIFEITEIVCFCSFFIGKAILSPITVVSLSQPDVARAVIGTGLYLTVLGLFGLAIGALIRHTAGGIAIVIGLVLVVGPLLALLDSYNWGKYVHGWFPTVAGGQITATMQDPGTVLSAWQGFAVFCGWTVLLLAVGAFLLQKRDA